MITPFALDHRVWTANADKLSQELKTNDRPPGFSGRLEPWVSGAVSARGLRELEARGGGTVVKRVGGRLDFVD